MGDGISDRLLFGDGFCLSLPMMAARPPFRTVVASSNGPTKGQCLGQALKSDGNGVSLALDVAGVGAGFLPGGGLVTGSARAATFAFGAQLVNQVTRKPG